MPQSPKARPVATRVDDPAATQRLFDALKERARGTTALVKVTKADAVAFTGMPAAQAEPALTELVKHYRSHVGVTAEGELVYEFDPTLERRDAVPLSERLGTLAARAWVGFQWLFKVWIAVTLVAYVVAFVVMMISLSVAKRSDSRRDDDGFGLPFIWYLLMPDLAPRGYGYGRGPYDAYGRPIARPPTGPKKRFYNVVFDFVFGPKPTLADPRAEDKRLIAFVQSKKGRVTAAEMAALSGVSLTRAEEELTRLLVEYDGEVEVADDGTLIYAFDDLRRQAALVKTPAPDFDRPEPDPALTGNTAGANTAVGAFAGFNVIAALTIGPAFALKYGLGESALFWVSVFPLIFSAVFLAIPATRWVVERGRKAKRRRRRARKLLQRAAFAAGSHGLDPQALVADVAQKTGVSAGDVDQLLTGVVADLDGDVTNDAEGAVRYTFARVEEERRQAELARANAPDVGLGEEVFSSAAEGTGEIPSTAKSSTEKLTADKPSDAELERLAKLFGGTPRGRA